MGKFYPLAFILTTVLFDLVYAILFCLSYLSYFSSHFFLSFPVFYQTNAHVGGVLFFFFW